jgi:D-alanine-D-alanine ligase-like ATP-grasp enzyme
MQFTLPPPEFCDACGSDPIRHRVEYISLLLESVMSPLISPYAAQMQKLTRGRSNIPVSGVYRFFERHGWGEFKNQPDEQTLLLGKILWEEAARRGIIMREFRPFGLPKNLFVALMPDGRTLDFEGIPQPRGGAEGAWWMNDKSILKKRLRPLHIPVPQGGVAFTRAQGQIIFKRLPHPVIIKPAIGSASRHTTLHITTQEEFDRAFISAKKVSPWVVIEEELRGSVYRPTVVGCKLIATLRRDPPSVVGDDLHTIAELVAEANKHPSRQGPYFSRIPLSPLALKELAYQNLTLEDVPKKGRRVNLHQKINWGLGGTTTDVTEDVHPENIELFEKIATILNAPIVGIDFIIDDISRPWQEQDKCGVIECNSMPYFDNHHLPFEGISRDVAGPIWDLVL